jgi:hypothetical protein
VTVVRSLRACFLEPAPIARRDRLKGVDLPNGVSPVAADAEIKRLKIKGRPKEIQDRPDLPGFNGNKLNCCHLGLRICTSKCFCIYHVHRGSQPKNHLCVLSTSHKVTKCITFPNQITSQLLSYPKNWKRDGNIALQLLAPTKHNKSPPRYTLDAFEYDRSGGSSAHARTPQCLLTPVFSLVLGHNTFL